MDGSVGLSKAKRNFLVVFFLFQSTALLYTSFPTSRWETSTEYRRGWAWAEKLEGWMAELGKSSRNDFLSAYASALGIHQNWKTFAPFPPYRFANYTVVVKSESDEVVSWNDHAYLNRSGAGLYFNPNVKLSSHMGSMDPGVRKLILRWQYDQYVRRTGKPPKEIRLQSTWMSIDTSEDGVVYKGPFRTNVLRREFE